LLFNWLAVPARTAGQIGSELTQLSTLFAAIVMSPCVFCENRAENGRSARAADGPAHSPATMTQATTHKQRPTLAPVTWAPSARTGRIIRGVPQAESPAAPTVVQRARSRRVASAGAGARSSLSVGVLERPQVDVWSPARHPLRHCLPDRRRVLETVARAG
jgi:hypothetical protein